MKRNTIVSILWTVVLILGTASCHRRADQNALPQPPFTSLESLEGHTVAVMAGSTSDILLADTHNFNNITLLRCDSPTELLAAVEDGTAQCAVSDTVLLMPRQREHPDLKIYFNLPGGFDVAVAFNHRDKELCRTFNDFLVLIKADGTLDEMLTRWCSADIDTVHTPSLTGLDSLRGHPLEVATLADNEPFSFYRNGHWTGFEVELMMRFSLYAGRPVHFSGHPFGQISDILRDGQADMAAANMFITPSRADQLLFSHPYYLCKTCCFGK